MQIFARVLLLLQNIEAWLSRMIFKHLWRVSPAGGHHAVNHAGQSLLPGVGRALWLLPCDIWENWLTSTGIHGGMWSLSLPEFHLLGKWCGLSSHTQKVYVYHRGMVCAHGVIRADFTILSILLYVSSIGRPSGLTPVSETSKTCANKKKKPSQPNNSPLPFFFFIIFL